MVDTTKDTRKMKLEYWNIGILEWWEGRGASMIPSFHHSIIPARRRRGLTLIEMSVAMLASAVMFLAVMNVLAANQKNFNQTYMRVYGEVVQDAYTVRRVFEGIVRKASSGYTDPVETPVGGSTYVEVRYAGTLGGAVDKFARFAYDAGTQTLTLTQADIGQAGTAQVIARNVTSCSFARSGPCIHMALVLDDGTTNQTVAVTAVRRNE
jgi:prepilin-type N-terminal cleavage/methylation domain-containing protein